MLPLVKQEGGSLRFILQLSLITYIRVFLKVILSIKLFMGHFLWSHYFKLHPLPPALCSFTTFLY